jgi:hypothetical protein
MLGVRAASAAATRAALVAIAVAACAPPRPAVATTVESIAMPAQAASADRIFVGTVTEVSSRANASAPKYFETVVRFTVEESVAGDVPTTVEIVMSGGEVGGIRQRVDGMPELAVGERYVVLLDAAREPRRTSPFVGFNQGLYRVVGASRSDAVVRDRRGKPLPASAVPAGARAAGDPPLDDFLETLRAARSR